MERFPYASKVARYTLAAFYVIPAVYSLFMLVREFIITRRAHSTPRVGCFNCNLTTKKLFYFVILCHQAARSILFFIPVEIYDRMHSVDNWEVLQNTLDLIPDFLFMLSYFLLLSEWIYTFHKSNISTTSKWSRYLSASSLTFIAGSLFLTAIICATNIAISAVKFQGERYAKYEKIVEGQGYLLFSITLLATILVLMYYLLLYCKVKRSKYRFHIQDHIKSGMTRFQLMSGIYFTFLLLHAIYIVVLNVVIRKLWVAGQVNDDIYFSMWSLYFIIGEELPATLIFLILSWADFQKNKNVGETNEAPHVVDTDTEEFGYGFDHEDDTTPVP
ncbi:hypothetical protein AKO1_007417 [Acrasis kona]|uniref:THH1/TOM1/TOM3 domain-containing protein n=1 Tax=Acrasis kona TaxID=1008807 RepID=A0AAW2YR30_9EUKA